MRSDTVVAGSLEEDSWIALPVPHGLLCRSDEEGVKNTPFTVFPSPTAETVDYRGASVSSALNAQLSRQCRHAELMERSTSSAWKGVARTS
jgi:hypothetical protein